MTVVRMTVVRLTAGSIFIFFIRLLHCCVIVALPAVCLLYDAV